MPPHRRAVPHRHHPPIPWSHTAPAPTLTLTGARPPVHPRARPVLLDLALRAAPLRQAHRDAARPALRPHLLLQGPLPLRSDAHVTQGCSVGRTRLQPGVRPRLQPGRQGRHRSASHLPQGTSPCRSFSRTEHQSALARSSPGGHGKVRGTFRVRVRPPQYPPLRARAARHAVRAGVRPRYPPLHAPPTCPR